MEKNFYPDYPVVLVDDEEDLLAELSKSLRSISINNIITCHDSRNLLNIINKQRISILVLDLMMPFLTGEEILQKLSISHPYIPVIVLTASNKIETAIKCMKIGAKDFILKPVERDEFVNRVRKVLEFYELQVENQQLTSHFLSEGLKNPSAFQDIITNNKKMKLIFKYLEAISKSTFPVLITGESGVGKELIAKAIHKLSENTNEMVSVNVAGLDNTFFSDTLFGHMKGAYTGADNSRTGLIEKAQNSTLFLDEIGDLEPNSQKKLLRLLQEREYYKLGSDNPKISSARIITATCLDLEKKVKENRFRQDLYYRLKTHYVEIPPLRERKEDIPSLISHIFKNIIKKPNLEIPKEVLKLLSLYNYPGNIRELQSIIIDLCALSDQETLSEDVVRNYFYTHNIFLNENESDYDLFGYIQHNKKVPTLTEVEILVIKKAMQASNNCQSVAAPLLGITQSALSKKLKKFNIK